MLIELVDGELDGMHIEIPDGVSAFNLSRSRQGRPSTLLTTTMDEPIAAGVDRYVIQDVSNWNEPVRFILLRHE